MRASAKAGLGVVAAGALAAGLATGAGDGARASSADTAAPATARVARTTLVDRLRVDGTLGYGDARTVAGRLAGTVTWLAPEGSVVKPGGVLARVDEQPVVLLDGRVPAYRRLDTSVTDGEDVRQLERGLESLGHDPGTVDDDFTSATAAAVRDWQESRGLAETGAVEAGRIVFQPGARRIASHKADIGAPASGALLETTSTRREVAIDLDAADQSVARRGAGVEVELPDGTLAPGRIASVGTVAKLPQGDDPGGDGAPAVEVTVRLTGRKRGGRLDQAPVSVELARERRRDVLAVPVTALVARRGGGYALDALVGTARRLVAVQPGLFADGLVEVTGAGVREGMRVVVPRS